MNIKIVSEHRFDTEFSIDLIEAFNGVIQRRDSKL